jgi:hypothetical protein
MADFRVVSERDRLSTDAISGLSNQLAHARKDIEPLKHMFLLTSFDSKKFCEIL